MNTIRAFVRSILNESGGITSVPGGISNELKKYVKINDGEGLDEASKAGLASANAMLADSRAAILRDVATAIENHPIEVGVAINDGNLLDLSNAMVELLEKDLDALNIDPESYNYPYRAGLYVMSWQNGLQDPPAWIEEWFTDFLGRAKLGVAAYAKQVEAAAEQAGDAGVEAAGEVSDFIAGSGEDAASADGSLREGLTIFGGSVAAGHLLAELVWPILRKRMSGISVNLTKWMLANENKAVWTATFKKLAAGESDRGWKSFLTRAGGDKLNYIFTGRDVGEMRKGSKTAMDAFALLNRISPALKVEMNRTPGDFLDENARDGFLEETRKAILNKLDQGAETIPPGSLAQDLLDTPPNVNIPNSDFANITAIVNAYKAVKDQPGDRFTVTLHIPVTGSNVRVPTDLEILKQDGAVFNNFLVKYSEGVEKVVNVYGKLRKGSIAMHAAERAIIYVPIHFIAEFVYETTFIGFDHLPLDVSDETLGAIFTAAAIREAIYTASNELYGEIDYQGLEQLSKANAGLVELTNRDLSTPCTAEEILNLKIMYEAAVAELENI